MASRSVLTVVSDSGGMNFIASPCDERYYITSQLDLKDLINLIADHLAY